MIFDSAFFDQGVDRIGTKSEKWDNLFKREGDDILPMWVADMDFQSPPAVVDALRERVQRLTFGYTESDSDDKQAFTSFWQRRHGLTVDPDWMIASPCVITGLRLGVRALSKPDGGVIIQTPVYGPFFSSIKESGRKIAENPLVLRDGTYTINFTQLESLLAGGNRLLMLCSPHNPTGRCFTRAELTRMVDLCTAYGAKIICDEIHADFVFKPNTFTPLLSIPGADKISMTLCAPSKTFNVAGLKNSTILAPDAKVREAIHGDMQRCGIVGENLFGFIAATAAYTHGDAWLDGLLDYLAVSKQMVYDFFAENLPHIKVAPLEATYLMWLDCRALGVDNAELVRRTTKKARIALTDGEFFGAQGKGFMRLNIGCPHAQLKEALRRLDIALKQN